MKSIINISIYLQVAEDKVETSSLQQTMMNLFYIAKGTKSPPDEPLSKLLV